MQHGRLFSWHTPPDKITHITSMFDSILPRIFGRLDNFQLIFFDMPAYFDIERALKVKAPRIEKEAQCEGKDVCLSSLITSILEMGMGMFISGRPQCTSLDRGFQTLSKLMKQTWRPASL